MKHVLYVEDNPGDVAATREALREIGAPITIHAVENAVQAFRFLARRDHYREAPRPDAILLDLHLPVLSGQRVLEELRNDAEWKPIAVLMVSSTALPQDQAAAAELGARFLIKPKIWADYLALARQVQQCVERRAESQGSTG